MRRVVTSCVGVLLLMASLPVLAADPPKAAKPTPSVDQVASEVKKLLAKENIQTRFDLVRRLQQQGLTWQPSLVAPGNLAGRLSEENLRYYAGIKMFDALYAASFMQWQAVSDSVQTIEQVQEKLNIRSYADVSGGIVSTLKKAAAAPEKTNVPALIDQLAADFSRDVPALMANPKSATYLVDLLYGFTIETGYMLSHFYRTDAKGEGPVMKAVPQQKTGVTDWLEILLQVTEIVGKSNETITVKGKAVPKMDLIKEIIRVRKQADQSPQALAAGRASVYGQAASIRDAIVTSSSASQK